MVAKTALPAKYLIHYESTTHLGSDMQALLIPSIIDNNRPSALTVKEVLRE